MLPRRTVDWPSVVLGAVARSAFVVGLHATLRWLFQHATREAPPRLWRFRSSVACTGSVRLLSDKTDPNVIRALGTPSGGEDLLRR